MDKDEKALKDLRKQLAGAILLAKVANESGDYKDMYNYVCQLIEYKVALNVDFDSEERQMISVGFRNYIGELQSSVKVVHALTKTRKYYKYEEALPDLENKLRNTLKDRCIQITEILRVKAYKVCSDNESMCFFQKLLGDYFRYAYEALEVNFYVKPERKALVKEEEISPQKQKMLADKAALEAGNDYVQELEIKKPPPIVIPVKEEPEVKEIVSPSFRKKTKSQIRKLEIKAEEAKKPPKEVHPRQSEIDQNKYDREDLKQKALKAYSFGQHKSERGVAAQNPIRMGLALHMAIFTHDIMGECDEGIEIASRMIKISEKKLDLIGNDDVRQDADTILKLLKDFVQQAELEQTIKAQEDNDNFFERREDSIGGGDLH